MSSLAISEDNPFQVLIKESDDNPTALQLRYQNHRVNRNEQQSTKILADSFPGWSLDPILSRLDGPGKEDGYLDPRNCLVIWARPPPHIRDLICFIQKELKEVSPSIWLMPPQNLHTTVLEVAHSLTEKEIEHLVQTLEASKDVTAAQIAEYPVAHKSRLLKPMVSFDASAMALSFVPAAGENLQAGDSGDDYSYHHLRRDVFQMVRQAQLPVASRYIVPSAHVTIARFINNEDFLVQGAEGVELDRARVKLLVEKIEAINKKLESEFWPRADGTFPEGGEWIVGQQNLVIRRGRLWYGGGETVSTGSDN
ncbi:RNA ligase/cyclic nucleotide phosphodiesterase [Penicillium frequentans]|uniref:RNA ligase/cyclic nucleotide phosphodiesterase n=1 Tax=Penicillium frequentans TaxID=3151616 RepID=A0AAD6GBH6_9EURO|nr:RNA ligase/cyclic nucleotide phosphodiesterase [Penicillium glabrum]